MSPLANGVGNDQAATIGKVDCAIDATDDETAGLELESNTSQTALGATKATPSDPGSAPPPHTVAASVALYAFCSSTLLVVNKVAMHMVPDASFVLFCQFLSSALAVKGLKYVKPDMDIEPLKWEKAKPFAAATLVFYICLLANTQALKSVNVETVIVVRSCSPIAVSILDSVALGQDLPNLKGFLALFTIAGGAAIYVVVDAGFHVEGYAWLMVYFVFIVIEMVFVKFIVETIPMSTWTRVYYNNTLSLPMAMLSALLLGDLTFLKVQWTIWSVLIVGASCLIGIAISYAGFNLRKLVSATSFTVVGVVCKILTVLINDVIWTKHSNALGHLGLLLCIVAGFAYERVKAKQRAVSGPRGRS